ncbi:MAG: aminoacetone oxidase family FAD-binding enzyme [Candidatus Izimaplasma sp.]|nr:aminoacetone oxidase family FAD-binding enzyme [Candidatus Izimaplasma bacterium]
MYDAIIIGSGPAGLMAANQLEKSNKNYLLLEKNSVLSEKLLLSGNKQCNVTNNKTTEEFISDLTLPHKYFLYATLYKFGPNDVIKFFQEKNVELVLENQFKYFPKTKSSTSIKNALLQDLTKQKILRTNEVKSLFKEGETFTVNTKNTQYNTKNVIIATGSKSYPLTGSTGFGLAVAKRFDIDTKAFYAAETSIKSEFVKRELSTLQGTTIKQATVKLIDTAHSVIDDLLFTHFGLSGPAIFKISEFLTTTPNPTLQISFTNHSKDVVVSMLKDPKNNNKTINQFLNSLTTKKISSLVQTQLSLENKRLTEYAHKQLEKIANYLTEFIISDPKLFPKEQAYVNGGGILTTALNPETFETKKIKGLFFIGETVDIHGPLGGYNITLALSTGYSAGYYIGGN